MEKRPNRHVGLIAAGVVLLLAVILGLLTLARNSNPAEQGVTVTVQPTETVTPTTTVSPTSQTTSASMKLYKNHGFSLEYPSDWKVEENASGADDVEFSDPTSLQQKTTNGGGKITIPTRFVDVMTDDGFKSVKDYVDFATKGPEYNGHSDRKPITVNGLQGEIFTEQGEGSSGKDIVLSDGKQIYVINVVDNSYPDPTQSPVIKNIFNSFSFIK